jgi:hypothetical protein
VTRSPTPRPDLHIDILDPKPDLRTIGFSIYEVFRGMFAYAEGHRIHWVRPSDDAPWEKCPLGDGCPGLRSCNSEKVLGDRYVKPGVN